MSSQLEHWYYVKDNILYEHYENDGYALMRRGFEKHDYCLGPLEKAKTDHPQKWNEYMRDKAAEEKNEYKRDYYEAKAWEAALN